MDTGFVRIKIRVSSVVEVDQVYSYIILLVRLLFVQISVCVTALTKYVLFALLWQNHFYSFVFVNNKVSFFQFSRYCKPIISRSLSYDSFAIHKCIICLL